MFATSESVVAGTKRRRINNTSCVVASFRLAGIQLHTLTWQQNSLRRSTRYFDRDRAILKADVLMMSESRVGATFDRQTQWNQKARTAALSMLVTMSLCSSLNIAHFLLFLFRFLLLFLFLSLSVCFSLSLATHELPQYLPFLSF